MSVQTLAVKAQRLETEQTLTEQRNGRRHVYRCLQLVAPFDGSRLPRQDEFGWAKFKDVSKSGISFLSETRPATKQLVVAVGPAPFSFLVVEVVRASKRSDLENRPYHVACRILRELTE
ncbi:MAG: hypothetical protein IAF94_04135 [Pirellulaceae bacterium]|nr:hypothetical protein [Pirellulaceae bacterium]